MQCESRQQIAWLACWQELPIRVKIREFGAAIRCQRPASAATVDQSRTRLQGTYIGPLCGV